MRTMPAADSRERRKNMLVIGDYLPTPDWDGGSLRILHLLKIFQEFSREVTYVPRLAGIPHQGISSQQAVESLKKHGLKIAGGQGSELATQHLHDCGRNYDMVMLCGAFSASEYIQTIRQVAPDAIIIYDTVDLHHIRAFREAKISGNRALLQMALRLKKNELNIAKFADWTLVVTEREKTILEAECPGAKVFVLSNVHPMPNSASAFSQRTDLLFIGAFNHTPNLDAALFLIREIFPLIRKTIPRIKLLVVGSDPPEELQHLQAPDIVVTGHVEDLDFIFKRCRLSIAPLRFGAGIKGKILTSLSYGVPVVASAVAAEGTGLEDGKDFLLAETPAEHCERISRLYCNEALWEQFSKNGKRFIEERFSIGATRTRVSAFLERMNDPQTASRSL